LWDDIVRTGGNDAIAVHFIGSIVYIEQGLVPTTLLSPLLVIDGQQRLTSVLIALCALRDHAASGDPQETERFNELYLVNKYAKDVSYYRLLPTQSDREAFFACVKTDATRLQAQASDQWAYYQAKGIKGAVEEATRAAWQAANKTPPEILEQTAQRYAREQEGIKKQAEEKERERDEKSKEADQLLARHHGFANAVALFQIAIALGAVAALTHTRTVWLGSMVVGAVAIVLFASQFV